MKRFGYLATTDLASEGRGSHFTKWRPGDIKMARASTFVERFHRLWGLWMCLTEYYKRNEGGGWFKARVRAAYMG